MNSETKLLVTRNYFLSKTQNEIKDSMRMRLINWLIKVHSKFKLSPESIFLTVSILDRFLSKTRIIRRDLQLVGMMSLMIASKYEDTFPPTLEELEYICGKTYSKNELKNCELKILFDLGFNFTYSTIFHFLTKIFNCQNFTEMEKFTANYISEICLLRIEFLFNCPSLIAAVCIYLSIRINNNNILMWNKKLIQITGYREYKLNQLAKKILFFIKTCFTEFKYISKKYKVKKFNSCSSMVQNKIKYLI